MSDDNTGDSLTTGAPPDDEAILPERKKDPAAAARAKNNAKNLIGHHAPKIGKNNMILEHPAGPAMSKLTPLQQRFCQLTIDAPLCSNVKLLFQAGYKGSNDAAKALLRRLMKNAIFIEARTELAKLRMMQIAPKGVHALDEMVADPKHKDHLKAVNSLLDRTGFMRVTKTEQTITHEFDRAGLVAKIAAFFDRSPDGNKLLQQKVVKQGDVVMLEAQIVSADD